MNGDIITLSFPAKPEYILAVRLAVSAVAERVGFDIDDIEDLKVASAEACTLLLMDTPKTVDLSMTVQDGLCLEFHAEGQSGCAREKDETGELSQYLLEALVDGCEFHNQDDVLKAVSFMKKR